MQFPGLFILQIISSVIVLFSPPHSLPAKILTSSVKQVLGVTYLAQDTTDQQSTDQNQQPSSDQTSQPQQPSSNQTSQPQQSTDQTQQTAPQQTTQTDQSTQSQQQAGPTDTPAPQQQMQQPEQQITPEIQPSAAEISSQPTIALSQSETNLLSESSPTPIEGQSAEISPTLESSPTQFAHEGQIDTSNIENISPESITTNSFVDTSVVNADAEISSGENVSQNIIDTAQKEDKEVEAETDPGKQQQVLQNQIKTSVVEINKTISADNFSNTSFITQRLINNISLTKDDIQKMATGIAKNQANAQLQVLCSQANLALKTQQLLVPEQLEQDLEVARSLCTE